MAFGFFKKKAACADKVFHNGHIYTMDPGLPWAEAVAVYDGEVMAVGNYDQMDSIIDDDTEIIDLDGKYMLPGFIDIHHSPVMKMIGTDGIDEEEEQEAEEAEEKNIFASMDHAEVYEYADDGEIDEWAAEDEEEPKDVEEAEDTEDEGNSEDPDEYYDEEDDTEYYVDNSEFNSKVEETISALADHGFTTVLDIATPHQIENEFINSLIEFYTEDKLRQRFFGSLYINQPVPARFVKEVLNMRRTKCTELGDMIKNEFLYIRLDQESGKEFPEEALQEIMTECADRGFSFYVEAVGREDLLKIYRSVDHIRNRGYKNTVIIASDEDLTDEEDAGFSASGTVYLTWRSDELGRSFFEGEITDIEEAVEHLTMESAEMIGMADKLGSIEKGKYADFAVFSENPLDRRPGELSRLYCDMTVVNGEIVHDVDEENDDYMMDMILHSR